MKKLKIGVMLISINIGYWEYVKGLVESARKHFLKEHEVEYMLWSDMPKETNYGCTFFETDTVEWPYPTLLRYDLFLQKEEYLRKFDYLFFVDIDAIIMGDIGNEILGNGLTAVLHPMYALRPEYQAPYEPNPESAAYVPRHHYYAGGFQGGKTDDFIKAMWAMKRSIGRDFSKNYRARWNDESHWNAYLYDHEPSVILSPAYCYPDSIIKEYYVPIWGQDYEPKIKVLTKKFTSSKEGGDALKKILASNK